MSKPLYIFFVRKFFLQKLLIYLYSDNYLHTFVKEIFCMIGARNGTRNFLLNTYFPCHLVVVIIGLFFYVSISSSFTISLLPSFAHRHTQDDKFYIEARDPGTKEVLVIDRLSQEIILEGNSTPLLW